MSEGATKPEGVPGVRWLTTIALIAAGFCLLVSGVMLYQHSRASERDPWKSPQLLALKDRLRAAPTDEAIKAEIRRLDLEFRQRYVRRLSLNRTGGWLLVGGLVVAVWSAQKAAKLRERSWLPKLDPEAAAKQRRDQTRARQAVIVASVITGASLLLIGLTATSPLPPPTDELNPSPGPDAAPAAATVVSAAEFQVNWPQFRGFGGSGVATGRTFTASGATVLWKTPLPAPGFSSPVTWSNRVFLSGGTAERREVICLDANDGQLLWQRAVENVPGSPAEAPEIPEMTGYAASTMATDGQRAFAIFPNGDLAAFNFDGSLAWAKHLGVPKNMYGYASSLAIAPGRLVVQWDQDEGAPGGSKLLALDCATGRQIWERPKPTHGSWASPIIIEAAGRTQIITLALPWVMSHALADGMESWRADLMNGEIAPSPVFAGGLVLVVSPSGDFIALRPDGAGDVTKSHVAWTAADNLPDITSPVSDGQLAFTVTTPGGLACFELTTGKMLWQHELEVEVQSSPSIVGGELVVVGAKGELITVAVAREFKELARLTLADAFYASPAFAGNRLILRGATNLWCLGTATKGADGH